MSHEPYLQERRSESRLARPFSAAIAEFVFPMSCQPKYQAECVDITALGAMLQVSTVIPKGSVQQISIELPGFEKKLQKKHVLSCDSPYQVRVIARVVWVKDEGDTSMIGVHFLNMSKGAQNALARYLKEFLK